MAKTWIKFIGNQYIIIKLVIMVAFLIFFVFSYMEIPEKVYLSDKTVKILKQKYPDELLCFFSEVSFGAESEKVSRIIRKWEKPRVSISFASEYTEKDMEYLTYCINEVNAVSKTTKFYYTNTEYPDVKIYILRNKYGISYGYPYLIKNRVVKFYITIYENDNDVFGNKYFFIHELFHALSCTYRNSYTYDNCILGRYISTESIIDNDSIIKYSDIERSLIDIMYNYDIRSGLDAETFNRQLKLNCKVK